MAPPGARTGFRDADIGLEAHLTPTPGVGGRLKTRIEDFRVRELGPGPPPTPTGRYVAARLRLTNWETHAFAQEAAARLGVSHKKVHFAGTKDKRAVTEQWFTFDGDPTRVADLATVPGVHVVAQHRTDAELELGEHEGNAFELVLRGLEADAPTTRQSVDATLARIREVGGVPNFFGPQRFGAVRATTHRVGEAILRGDFLGAVLVYLCDPGPNEPEALRDARASLARDKDWPRALREFPSDLHFERALLHRLVETEGDALLALHALPRNLQRLFVSAFQSLLFNRVLSRRLRAGTPIWAPVPGDLMAVVEGGHAGDDFVPVTEGNLERAAVEAQKGRAAVTGLLPGTQAPFAEGPMGRWEREVLSEAGFAPRDFLVPEELEWSSKGTRRPLLVSIHGLGWDVATDELQPGRTKLTLRFELPPGSYATCVVREVSKSPWLEDYA